MGGGSPLSRPDVADKLTGEENRKHLMVEYQRLMSESRIRFVTFHQSMSYEEFVEGLRPSTADPGETSVGFSLEPVDGVFKRISAQALAGRRSCSRHRDPLVLVFRHHGPDGARHFID